MNYPLISEYIEAIKASEENFEHMKDLRPVLGEDGEPVMVIGDSSVVFKMKDEKTESFHAVKCFLKDQENREEAYSLIKEELFDMFQMSSYHYILPSDYRDKELVVYTTQTSETRFPILCMQWVEGKTLIQYIIENINNKDNLENLGNQFFLLFLWLIPKPFAHGDIKPDNIIVSKDGTLTLIDYDCMYVPTMKGWRAHKLGSPDFRHPLRTEEDFDEHIDDFPLISILLSLKAITHNVQLFEKYGKTDRLLFSYNDYLDICNCSFLKDFFPNSDCLANTLVTIFVNCLNHRIISKNLFSIIVEEVRSELSKLICVDESNRVVDSLGTEYSLDKKRLYKVGRVSGIRLDSYQGHYIRSVSYNLDKEIDIICNNAFSGDIELPYGYIPNDNYDLEISISDHYIAIGDYAFKGKSFVYSLDLSGVILFGRNPFALTEDVKLRNIYDSPYYSFSDMAIFSSNMELLIHEYNDDFTLYEIPYGVKIIGEYSFSRKVFRDNKPHYIIISETVERIEDYAFMNLDLRRITMPKPYKIRSFGKEVFKNCYNLREILIPQGTFDFYCELFPEYKRLIKEDGLVEFKSLEDEGLPF